MNKLVFWTGGDAERVDTLFRSSRLMRPKWGEPRGQSTYGQREIEESMRSTRNRYDPARAESLAATGKR